MKKAMNAQVLITDSEPTKVRKIFVRHEPAFGAEVWITFQGPYKENGGTALGSRGGSFHSVTMDSFMEGSSIRGARPGEAEALYKSWCGGNFNDEVARMTGDAKS